MPHVITQSCCNDASCTAVCPVDCIHPTMDEPRYATAESLYIDPDACIDCGACVEHCPVDAIVADDRLSPDQQRFQQINASYFTAYPTVARSTPVSPVPSAENLSGIRIGVVGTGPAGMYTALELLNHRGVDIELYDRSVTPYGLLRTGVAPDHPDTKAMANLFDPALRKRNVSLHLGVAVGSDVSTDELLAHHSAVVFATGAATSRRTNIPGSELAGVHSATRFVGWYNGGVDEASASFDLSGQRVVIIGNGNVAIDVARILLSDPAHLARTDITDHALEALRSSSIREVVLLGRRGPAQASYTTPEFLALLNRSDFNVVIDPDEAAPDDLSRHQIVNDPVAAFKVQLAQEVAGRRPSGAARRLVFRYLTSPVRYSGTGAVAAVHVSRNTLASGHDGVVQAISGPEAEVIDTSLVLEAIGYRGTEVPGLPFDPHRGVIPNRNGRVLSDAEGDPVPGAYVVGWSKRGPLGVIGSNKRCARETVSCLLDDIGAGVVTAAPERAELVALLARRRPDAVGYDGWSRIDSAERSAGDRTGRPRLKLTDVDELRRAAAAL